MTILLPSSLRGTGTAGALDTQEGQQRGNLVTASVSGAAASVISKAQFLGRIDEAMALTNNAAQAIALTGTSSAKWRGQAHFVNIALDDVSRGAAAIDFPPGSSVEVTPDALGAAADAAQTLRETLPVLQAPLGLSAMHHEVKVSLADRFRLMRGLDEPTRLALLDTFDAAAGHLEEAARLA